VRVWTGSNWAGVKPSDGLLLTKYESSSYAEFSVDGLSAPQGLCSIEFRVFSWNRPKVTALTLPMLNFIQQKYLLLFVSMLV
jgi:hypothetical protein